MSTAYPLAAFMRDEPAPWMDPVAPTASCAEVDPELWHPEKGGSTREAKRICRQCPLVAACRGWALDHPHEARYGVWGGLSERERREVRRQRRRDLAVAAARVDVNEMSEVA